MALSQFCLGVIGGVGNLRAADLCLIEMMKQHWDDVFAATPHRFGDAASVSGVAALAAFENRRPAVRTLLDLGAGSGRDALFFAAKGLQVTAVDFSGVALDVLTRDARSAGVPGKIQTIEHDVRQSLPFADASFDACYAHMLYCMDLSFAEIAALFAQVRRIVKPGGIHVYTVRTTKDPDYGLGIHHGERRYEDEGFTVHFFDRRMVDELSAGFEQLSVTEFEEGALPRHLFAVTLRAV